MDQFFGPEDLGDPPRPRAQTLRTRSTVPQPPLRPSTAPSRISSSDKTNDPHIPEANRSSSKKSPQILDPITTDDPTTESTTLALKRGRPKKIHINDKTQSKITSYLPPDLRQSSAPYPLIPPYSLTSVLLLHDTHGPELTDDSNDPDYLDSDQDYHEDLNMSDSHPSTPRKLSEPEDYTPSTQQTRIFYTPVFIPPKPVVPPSDADLRCLIWPNPPSEFTSGTVESILSKYDILYDRITPTRKGGFVIVFSSPIDLTRFESISSKSGFYSPTTSTPLDLSKCHPPLNVTRTSSNNKERWFLITAQEELALLRHHLEEGESDPNLLRPGDRHSCTARVLQNILSPKNNIKSIRATPSGKLVFLFHSDKDAQAYTSDKTIRIQTGSKTISLRPDNTWSPANDNDTVPFCNFCCNIGHRSGECPEPLHRCRTCGSPTHSSNPSGSCPRGVIHPNNKSKSLLFCILCGSTEHCAGNRHCRVLTDAISYHQNRPLEPTPTSNLKSKPTSLEDSRPPKSRRTSSSKSASSPPETHPQSIPSKHMETSPTVDLNSTSTHVQLAQARETIAQLQTQIANHLTHIQYLSNQLRTANDIILQLSQAPSTQSSIYPAPYASIPPYPWTQPTTFNWPHHGPSYLNLPHNFSSHSTIMSSTPSLPSSTSGSQQPTPTPPTTAKKTTPPP